MKNVGLDDLSVVILSHNRGEVLKNNVERILNLVLRYGCELIVVDNASTDGTVELISSTLAGKDGTVFVRNTTNLGVAGGRNVGWRAATRDFILNIDDDTLVTADSIQTLKSQLLRYPQLGIVSPRIVHAGTGSPQLSFEEQSREVANFHGACHMVRRSLIDAIGFNDDACTFGGEELDLSIRARAAGFEVRYFGVTTVLHDNIVRKGEVGKDRRLRWVYNFTRVFYKHFPLRAAVPLSCRYLLSHLVSGVRGHGVGFVWPVVQATARGVLDGRRVHRPVPAEVVRFYTNPDLKPEFGNVPLWRKLRRKLLSA